MRRYWLCFFIFLAGCAPGSSGILDTARIVGAQLATTTEPDRLQAGFRYLRVAVDGRIELLALGYRESTVEPPTEVWYSAAGEVLQLQQGRVIGTTGLPVDWRNVRLSGAPGWAQVYSLPKDGVSYSRVRDVMPGYRFNISENLRLRPIDPPNNHKLKGVSAESLLWFEEVVVDTAIAKDQPKASRYALIKATSGRPAGVPVYGEQCLSVEFCFTWQIWPPISLQESP